jgi:hypothetical protein
VDRRERNVGFDMLLECRDRNHLGQNEQSCRCHGLFLYGTRWKPELVLRKIDEIYDTLLNIFETANAHGITPNRAADRLVEDRLREAGLR